MGRPKGGAPEASKKPKAKPKQRGGVDFKKYKHKVGRKLPPPKNTTNTEIKSKMIVLPEQSMASERAGMAVNKRGLKRRELLQQTVHYNPKVRRAALNGIKVLVTKHPAELKLHKVAMIEKLQERICDSDKVVRESLYTILQSLIFPSLKEAFNNFVAVLSNDRIHLQDKSKLNSVLAGLGHCLSLVARATENDDASNRPAKVLRNKDLMETYLGPLITCIPGLISNAADDSKGYLLEEKSGIAYTEHDSGISEYRSTWINELPGILLQSVDKAPTVTKVVLELLLRIRQYFPTLECGNLRPIAQLFGTKSSSGTVELGPFIYLPHDCQELAIACLYYFSNLLPHIIEPLDSNVPDVTYGEKQTLKFAFEQLKTKALQLNCWDRSELEGLSSTT
ncbi:hypothetical protein ACQ4PT_042862 [Festuca glaucescens]